MYRRIILTGLLSLLFLGTAPIVRSAEDPTDTTYIAQDIQGDVTVQRSGGMQAVPLEEGGELLVGDTVTVGENSEATLTWGDDQVIRLEEGTKLQLSQADKVPEGGLMTRWSLLAGNVLAEVKHLLERHSKFEVESGGVVCGVRGTVFEVAYDNGDVSTETHEGVVAVTGQGGEERVEAGKAAQFRNRRILRRWALGKTGLQRFARWREFREAIREKRLARREGRLREFRKDRLEKYRKLIHLKRMQAKRRILRRRR